MREVYIVDAVRTPVGRMGGTLKNTQAHEMGGLVCKALMERTGLAPELVEEVVIAQVKQNAVASNIARVCALMAGFREEIPAYTLMMQCGSSLQSVNCAANDIRCGDVDVAVAGGVEAMSATHFELWNARYGYGTGNNVLVDPIVEGAKRAQPQETYGVFGMGDTAENVAEQFHISREDMDEFAFHSQRKAAEAVAAGVFKDEIVPVVIPQRKKEPIVFDTDEQPRATTMEGLAKLKPVFRTDGKGKVTAGDSCGRSDAGRPAADERREGEGTGRQAHGPHRGPRHRRRGSPHHGHRPGARRPQGAGEGGTHTGRYRHDRAERGLRGPVPGGDPRAGAGYGQGKRQRRRHRHGAPSAPPAGAS